VGILLKHGANVNAKEPVREQTALMWAVGEKHPDVTRALIEHGADINAATKLGFTPLLFAAREGDLESAKLLLDKGVDVNISVGEEGETGEAVDLSGHQDSSKLSALHVAVQRGHSDLAALLLDRGADPNYDVPGWTPLHWAVGTWETELNGANGMTAPKGHEWDALRGVQEGKFELVKTLLEHGADPNAKLQGNPARYGFTVTKQPKGSTPLALAAFAGEGDIMRLLAEHGADMAASIESGKAPLLIAAGVDRFLAEWAVSEEALLTAVQAAIELGADVNDTDSGGNTALHGAVRIGATTIIQYLADAGADINAKNKEGRTPMNLARYSRGQKIEQSEVIDLLQELSIPPALRESINQWETVPGPATDAVVSLLTGRLHKQTEEGKQNREESKQSQEKNKP
jgi:ankyrin repeat protein